MHEKAINSQEQIKNNSRGPIPVHEGDLRYATSQRLKKQIKWLVGVVYITRRWSTLKNNQHHDAI